MRIAKKSITQKSQTQQQRKRGKDSAEATVQIPMHSWIFYTRKYTEPGYNQPHGSNPDAFMGFLYTKIYRTRVQPTTHNDYVIQITRINQHQSQQHLGISAAGVCQTI